MYIIGYSKYFSAMIKEMVTEMLYVDDNYQDVDYEDPKDNLTKNLKHKHDKPKIKSTFQVRKNNPVQGRNY